MYKYDLSEIIFLVGVGGLSVLGGFSYAISASRKQDDKVFKKKVLYSNIKYMKFKIFQLKRVVSLFQGVSEAVKLQMAGSQLAMRALKWGSVFAVVGVSSICFAVWKLSGARSVRCYVFFLLF